MPSNIQYRFGIRQNDDKCVAVCIFSIPPTRWKENVLELSRLVKKDGVDIPCVTLISKSVKWLKRTRHDLIVSYADNEQGHHGGVYQAASWNYSGCRKRSIDGIFIDGIFNPRRSLNSRYGTSSFNKLRVMFPSKQVDPHYDSGKYLYWKALNRFGSARAERLNLLSLPYPKPDCDLSSGQTLVPPRISQEHTLEVAPI